MRYFSFLVISVILCFPAFAQNPIPPTIAIEYQNELRQIQLTEVPIQAQMEQLKQQYLIEIQKIQPLQQKADKIIKEALVKAGFDPKEYRVAIIDANKIPIGMPNFDISTEHFVVEKIPPSPAPPPPATSKKPATKEPSKH